MEKSTSVISTTKYSADEPKGLSNGLWSVVTICTVEAVEYVIQLDDEAIVRVSAERFKALASFLNEITASEVLELKKPVRKLKRRKK